jgi:hypothetical protein
MVSATDYPGKSGILQHREATDRPRRRRFRLLSALAAPFQDIDERALHKKRKHEPVRNNSKGNLFTPGATARAKVLARRSPRRGD